MKLSPLKEVIDLTEKTAIVTGGAMGIGFGIAYRLAEAGAHMVIADLNEEAGNKAVKELTDDGFKAAFIQTDVASGEDVKRATDFTVETYGGVDILVNNAGIYPIIPVMQMTSADFEKILAINLKSVFLFSKNTALELAPHNIQVNAIAPGGIATPGTGAGQSVTPEMEVVLKKFLEKIPMKRMGDPDDIGKVALFLASDLASYMTGSQVVVDGGVLLS